MWRIRIACWAVKGTNTHPEYVTLIALLLQQWMHERDSVLRCTGCHPRCACKLMVVKVVFSLP